MQARWSWSTNYLSLAIAATLGGCRSVAHATSFEIAGAFFPEWMFCALLGIVVAIIARALLATRDGAVLLPYPLFVCSAIGLIAGVLFWLFVFGG